MAPPKAVARSLRKSATRLAAVRRESVVDAAQYAIEQASNRGGTFFGGRYPLTAEVVEKKDSSKRSTVLVYPKPAGGWSIKSYGRRESVGRPVLVIRGVGVRPRARAARGDGLWDRIKADTEANFVDVVESSVDEAIGEG